MAVQLGSLEREIMEVVWRAEDDLSVRDVLDSINGRGHRRRAYNSVMSVMSRLHDKGLLKRQKSGRSYRYRAVAGPEDAARSQVAQRVAILVDEHGGEVTVDGFIEAIRGDEALMRRARTRLDKL